MLLSEWNARFQEAALDPSQWLPVLQELADATGSSRAELVGIGGPGFMPFNWVTSTDERTLSDFLASGGASPASNYRVAADDGRSIMRIVDESDYDRTRAVIRADDYVDFCERHGMLFGCQTVLVREASGLVGLSLLRSRSDGRTDADVQRSFAAAADAARTAVRMQQAIEQQGHRLLNGTFEAMASPCLLLDGFGQVRAATTAAERVMRDNSALSVSGERLCATEPGTARKLQLALRAVLGPEQRAHARFAAGAGPMPGLVVDIFALPRRDWALPFAPRALLLMRDPTAIRSDAAVSLASAFGLTAAEAEVALMLSRGLSREQIAARRRVSPETLRSQLRSLYSKTGCSRETELVLLVKALTD